MCLTKVPYEEFKKNGFRGDIPKVENIIRLMDNARYMAGRHELLSDVFACGAICISNKFDMIHYKEREETYLKIIGKYDKKIQNLIADIFSQICILLMSAPVNGFSDYLGELYMRSDTQNKKGGQFFTPYHLSKLCAELTTDEEFILKCMENDEIIPLNEPACGSGGMILAMVDVLYNKYRFNYSRNLFVECSDIDLRCVHMTYLQLSCAGIPAVIYHRDTISMKTWSRWDTPAYIMQYLRFRNIGGDKIGAADRGVG